jgi:ABC-2 type transport system permease protein
MRKNDMREIMAQEFRALFKGRFGTLATLFGVPIVYTLLFGLLYSTNVVKHIPLVVFDQDQTTTSHALVQAFADSERYEIVGQVVTQEDMEKFMRNNAAMAAVLHDFPATLN